MAKQIKVSKRAMVSEHARIIPKLRKAGLRKEARRQAKELKELRRK